MLVLSTADSSILYETLVPLALVAWGYFYYFYGLKHAVASRVGRA